MLLHNLLLVVFLAPNVSALFNTSCSRFPENSPASPSAATVLFRLYENFFTCLDEVGGLTLQLTGDPESIGVIVSNWRTNNGQYELLSEQLILVQGWQRGKLDVTLNPAWAVRPGHHLGIATTKNRLVAANRVAAHDTLSSPTAVFPPVKGMDGTWDDVLSRTQNRFLEMRVLTDAWSSSPLITPTPRVPSTTVKPATAKAEITPASAFYTTTSDWHVCAPLTAVGGHTKEIRGASRKPWSVTAVICPYSSVELREFRCVPYNDQYIWIAGRTRAQIRGDRQFYFCEVNRRYGR